MIVVTTPTGDIGHQVLENVLDSGEPVRVIVRDPARLAARTRARVEIVQGSHGDPDVVMRAFEGADSVFWLVPPAPRAESVNAAYLDFTRPACDALRIHSVKRVVGVSALGRGTPLSGHAGLATAALAMDDMISASGASYRALAMPSFMDNILRQIAPIRNQGVFFQPMAGDRKFPICATRDIAAVAARLLLDHSWSGTDTIAVLGPEDLSFNDMAVIMTEILDRPVRFQEISVEAFGSGLIERGMSKAFAAGLVEMMIAKNAGLDNAEPRTTENTTPTSFRQWCEDRLKPAVLG